jgi:hypothetical protein
MTREPALYRGDDRLLFGIIPGVHHPQYVFNDDLLPVGAAYWVTLTEQYLR